MSDFPGMMGQVPNDGIPAEPDAPAKVETKVIEVKQGETPPSVPQRGSIPAQPQTPPAPQQEQLPLPEQAAEETPAPKESAPPRDERLDMLNAISDKTKQREQDAWQQHLDNGGDPGFLPHEQEAQQAHEEAPAPEPPAPEPVEPEPQPNAELEQQRAELDAQRQQLAQWYDSLQQWQAIMDAKQQEAAQQPEEPPKPYEPPEEAVNEVMKMWTSADEDEARAGAVRLLKEAAKSQLPQQQVNPQVMSQQVAQMVMQQIQQDQAVRWQQTKEQTRGPAYEAFQKDYKAIVDDENLMDLAKLKASQIEQQHPDWDYHKVFKETGDAIMKVAGQQRPAPNFEEKLEQKRAAVVQMPQAAVRRPPAPEEKPPTNAQVIAEMASKRPGYIG